MGIVIVAVETSVCNELNSKAFGSRLKVSYNVQQHCFVTGLEDKC